MNATAANSTPSTVPGWLKFATSPIGVTGI